MLWKLLWFSHHVGVPGNVRNRAGVSSMLRRLKGTVISGSDNEPLIGAKCHGTREQKTGAVTDLDGNFTIEAKNGQTLEVSYLELYHPKD